MLNTDSHASTSPGDVSNVVSSEHPATIVAEDLGSCAESARNLECVAIQRDTGEIWSIDSKANSRRWDTSHAKERDAASAALRAIILPSGMIIIMHPSCL